MTLQFCEVNADQSAPLPLGPGSIPATVSNSTNKVKNFYLIKDKSTILTMENHTMSSVSLFIDLRWLQNK